MIKAVQLAVRFLAMPEGLTEVQMVKAKLVLTAAIPHDYSSDITVDLDDHVDGGKFLDIWVHGRNDKTVDVVREIVEEALQEGLDPDYEHDLDVEVWHYAGSPEP